MATYREMTSMVMDAMKGISDDFFYTEEHILFLLGRTRTLLLLRKYNAQRRYRTSPSLPSVTDISQENYQNICLDLQETDLLPNACGGAGWLRSTKKLPTLLGIGNTTAFPVNAMLGERITFIPEERMPFVGYNRWLKSIIYVAHGNDGYVYVHSSNPQFKYLRNLRINGIFEDAEAASELQCNDSGQPMPCDILDAKFPLEDGLLLTCVEYVIQELQGSVYAPQDKLNNAEDDLSKAAVTKPKGEEQK